MFKKIYTKTKNYFDQFFYLFKRHFLNQLNLKDYKKIIHYFKVIIRNKFFGFPRLAMIELGTTCNLRCATCPTPREYLGRPPALMSLNEFKRIIDNIKDYVHVVVLYVSNEPLLNPHLAEMVKYAAANHLYIMISTNAALLDEKRSNDLMNAGLDEILLCLDGMTKEAYEPFRTGANFDVVFNNIKNFCLEKKKRCLKKPYTEIQFIVTKLNQDQISEIKQFSKDISADRLRIKSIAFVEYGYSAEQRQALVDQFLPTRKDAKVRYEKDDAGKVNKKVLTHCNIIKNQIVILTDGRMAMCCYDVRGDYVFGNLFEKTFKEIWLDPENIKKRYLAENRKFPLCSKCELC